MSVATKENLPLQPARRTALVPAAVIIGDEREEDGERPGMLSPPPEEELKLRRMNNEPSSASKPLATSGRPNQLRASTQSPSNEVQTSKRKRALRSIETPPRSTRDSHQDQPKQVYTRYDSDHEQQQQQQSLAHTPNPRLRKQVRHASRSPTVGTFADGSPPPLPLGSGSPRASGPSSSSARKNLLQETTDANMMSPTRRSSKGKGRMVDLLTAIHSPHAANPTADYIPSSRLAVKPDGNVSVRRRSVTPIPPYVPPAERFTPPREIMSTPVHAEKKVERKPARRAATTKKRAETKVPPPTRIKTEPPEIDLTAPPPPASPSEDPILLVGSPPGPRARRASNLSFEAGKGKDLVDFEMELDLPADDSRNNSAAAAGPSAISTPRVDSSFTTGPISSAFDFTNIDDDESGPAVDFVSGPANGARTGSDSDSDEDEVTEGEGDYTGKFLSFKIPLKMDPPTSATRHRMEEWGRPISPHPKKFAFTDDEDDENEDAPEEGGVGDGGNEEHLKKISEASASQDAEGPEERRSAGQIKENEEKQNDARPAYQDRRCRRLTLSQLEAKKFGSPKEGEPRVGSLAARSDREERENEDIDDAEAQEQEQEQEKADSGGSDPIEHGDDGFTEQSMDLEDPDQAHAALGASGVFGTEDDQSGVQEQQRDHDVRSDTSELRVHGYSGDVPSSSQTETLVGRLESEQSFSRTLFSKERLSAPFGSTPSRETSIEEELTATRDDRTAVCEEAPASRERLEHESNSDSDSEEVTDLGVVKIVSNDPMAAARAAAILKLHDYDMIARRLRRKSTAGGGVRKAYGTPKKAELWRRRTIAGLSAEDTLSVNVTLPELVEKVEEELRSTPARSRAGSVSIAGTPKEAVRANSALQQDIWGPREWTKADWKLLDSCFTDERYYLAKAQGLPEGVLADVDEIESQNVVERFIMILGGVALTESHGPSWTNGKLLQRAHALRKRQMNGHGAPPTPVVARTHDFIHSPSSSMIVPEFTPTPAERIRHFRYPGLDSDTATSTPNSSDRIFKTPLPPSLAAGLGTSSLNEALARIAYSSRESDRSSVAEFNTPSRAGTPESSAARDEVSELPQMRTLMSTPMTTRVQQQQQTPMSAMKRSLNYISSWLRPGMFKSKELQRASSLPGLPVPPADVLAKPRGPITTPSKQPAPKPAHPKEQVTLQPAPAPKPPSKIPRVAKRLVELQHVPTPQPKPLISKTISRRSSGSSVKDLVNEFEEMENKVKPVPPRVAELRRMGSLDTLRSKQGQKPAWRP